MKLIKRLRIDHYMSEDGSLNVDVDRMNNGFMFSIESHNLNALGNTKRLHLSEEKLKALIDLYYEVRPAQRGPDCEHDWRYKTICNKCRKEV